MDPNRAASWSRTAFALVALSVVGPFVVVAVAGRPHDATRTVFYLAMAVPLLVAVGLVVAAAARRPYALVLPAVLGVAGALALAAAYAFMALNPHNLDDPDFGVGFLLLFGLLFALVGFAATWGAAARNRRQLQPSH